MCYFPLTGISAPQTTYYRGRFFLLIRKSTTKTVNLVSMQNEGVLVAPTKEILFYFSLFSPIGCESTTMPEKWKILDNREAVIAVAYE
ncbi:MAG: hypothetical protein ACXAD7_17530 [Candidatus Kariarchaeaceae archaeon]|jgi:hypothetical protein